MDYQLVKNETLKRFEVHLEGLTAFVDYKLLKDAIAFTHTEVPKELSGKGVGSFIAKRVLEYAKDHSLKVKPYCPFINAYIDKHPEYQENSLFHNKHKSL